LLQVKVVADGGSKNQQSRPDAFDGIYGEAGAKIGKTAVFNP
jgi:hypothetical protein